MRKAQFLATKYYESSGHLRLEYPGEHGGRGYGGVVGCIISTTGWSFEHGVSWLALAWV